MLIARAVTVKSKVTPALKAQLGAETQKAIRELELEIERSQSEKETRELRARREALMFKLRDIAKLVDGQEISRGTVQGFFEVKVGDVWSDVQSADIILEDGKVVAIREGAAVTVDVRRVTSSGDSGQ